MKTTLHKKMTTLGVALLTMGAVNAQATWTGATDTDFATGTNWSSGVLPSDEDVTIPNVTNSPVLSSVYPSNVDVITVEESASLVFDSGTLTTNSVGSTAASSFKGNVTLNGASDFKINHRGYFGNGVDTELNINGTSSLYVKSYFRVGVSANCTINVNGGTIDCDNSLFMGNYVGSGRKSTLNINSGTVTVNTLATYATRWDINIDGGTFILNGDQVSTIEGYVTSGRIHPASGKTISAVYNSETDKTTITATATLGFNNNASKVTTNVYVQGTTVFVSNVSTQTAVNVYSITGALVKSISTNTDTQFSLTSGVWIATVKTNEGQKSVKIVCN